MADGTCSIEDCDKRTARRGWCYTHYGRWYRNGDPLKLVLSPLAAECRVSDCDRKPIAKNLCNPHYLKQSKYGDPLGRHSRPEHCNVTGCMEPVNAKLMCRPHYDKQRRHGNPHHGERPRIPNCRVNDCESPPTSPFSGICAAHSHRLRRRGTTDSAYAVLNLPFLPACATCGQPNNRTTVVARQFCSTRCRQWARRGTRMQRSCEGCNVDLPAWARGFHRFCDRCAQERIRACTRRRVHRRRVVTEGFDGGTFERFADREIFDRDKWRCGLCRKRVSRRLQWPHPLSASLDHMVPIFEGGRHLRTNVQLAHLTCNLRKRERGGGEQLMLIG
jgi:endogenous inhibitor of DNA gyrase (YacG/DUF329 family)